MCSCGCYEDAESSQLSKERSDLFLRHSQAEFFSVGKYLVIGTFISLNISDNGIRIFTSAQSGAGLAISIIIMMAVAFVLTLCSSSDQRHCTQLCQPISDGCDYGIFSIWAMMDIKNVMMLSSGFSKRFIGKFLFTTFIVCFAVVFLLFGLGGI
jgi:uncharacterized membrane protein YraQ (UPF0718 family)